MDTIRGGAEAMAIIAFSLSLMATSAGVLAFVVAFLLGLLHVQLPIHIL